ncbi:MULTISPECIES: hypothetical protein [unclassified Saccharibacter]|uniref:hypothetical protein n=1 Tax=unclassified Saccharibacter TaxID=2648722 RepID=UPI001327F75F|nr:MULTISPECIES: hypothetical protein [unclassified Saccharibacter]MXV36999.1 hypothetical protein [Saccharibacter sp. EH611]MXV58511.1 hypothetical protein [Saccharibacter sp. EH70]MXV66017.1 hypothetical protein [Saccharibacter sp. EH60]
MILKNIAQEVLSEEAECCSYESWESLKKDILAKVEYSPLPPVNYKRFAPVDNKIERYRDVVMKFLLF